MDKTPGKMLRQYERKPPYFKKPDRIKIKMKQV
jgi:hypothetical protein